MIYTEKLTELKQTNFGINSKCFCKVRKSYINSTPEEKVRQNFLDYLIKIKKFPISKIRVEEPLARYGLGRGRIDILILDENNNPFIIYECKREFEVITDEVLDQALGYFNKVLTADYLGLVIGNEVKLVTHDENQLVLIADHPSYNKLLSGNDIFLEKMVIEKYERNNWQSPLDKDIIKYLIDYGIIGEGTDEKYYSFLVNLDGWLLDESDPLKSYEHITDLGIKLTKFGNAGGGNFTKEYRAFRIDNDSKPIICIGLTSMASSKNSPIRTSLIVGIETIHQKNASLELQIEKSVEIKNNYATITHNGAMTVGRLGAVKRKDLLNYIKEQNPKLIKGEQVYLGKFDINSEINARNVGNFIQNIIDYSLLRNEYREIRKKAVANKV